MNQKVLIVDDDAKICGLVSDILKENGFHTARAFTTEEGWDKLTQFHPHVVILDMDIPLKGGLEFCRDLKKNKSFQHIPILFLTVRGRDVDKIAAFSAGADDFMTKPFGQRELVARVQVALRRSAVINQSVRIVRLGSLTIDFDRRHVSIGSKEAPLSPKEFDLLTFFYLHRHRVLSDREIFGHLWGGNNTSLLATVYTHINRLRKKLKEHGSKIKTVPGTGFRFDEDACGKQVGRSKK